MLPTNEKPRYLSICPNRSSRLFNIPLPIAVKGLGAIRVPFSLAEKQHAPGAWPPSVVWSGTELRLEIIMIP